MRILVSQITRMGDVLQTSPLFTVIKRKYPDCHITALVRAMGKPIADRLPEVDEVIVYDEDDLFLDLTSGDSERLLRAYGRADALVKDLKGRNFDLVYNCTHSTTSSLLLKLVRFPQVIGTDYSGDWRFVIRGKWVYYFFTSIMAREYNNLNLCDVTQRFEPDHGERAGLAYAIYDDDRTKARALLAEKGIDPERPYVCFQIGASDDNKRWSAGYFAALAKAMAEKLGAQIILVGVDAEKKFGAEFEEHAPGLAVHLFGATSIPVLAAVLESARMLVTNDTGTMHIAAAARCPIVLVSVGYVVFRETGPYAAGCYAIERRKHDVRSSAFSAQASDVREHPLPEAVLRVVERAWNDTPLDPGSQWTDLQGWDDTYVYRSDFAADTCLEWYPAIRRPPSNLDLLRMAYRAMWLEHFDGPEAGGDEGFPALLAHFDLAPFPMATWTGETAAVFEELARMAQEGQTKTEQLQAVLTQSHAFGEAKRIVAELMEMDDRMRVYGEVNRSVRPLVVIARFGRDGLEGSDVHKLAADTLTIYRELAERCTAMARHLRRLNASARSMT